VSRQQIFTIKLFHFLSRPPVRLRRIYMSKKVLANAFLASLFVLGQYASTPAQSTLSAKTGGIPTKPASTVPESDRMRDGLSGPVRRIKTEIAKLNTVGGKSTEEKRALLEVASYDVKGVKTENQYFPVAGSTLTGKEVYKYDDKGNISEMTVLNDNGSLLSKEIYKYDFDSVGNWTRMTTLVAVIEGGNVTFEPTEVTYRSIMYYLDENMLKLSQPGSAAAPAAAPATVPAANNTNSVAAKTGAEVKPQPTVTPTASKTQSGKSGKGAPPQKVVALAPVRTLTNSSTANPALGPKLSSTPEPVQDIGVLMAAEPPPPGPKPILKPVSGGALNGRAIILPQPVYPDQARRARVSGTIVVEVVVDEQGKVISAIAKEGPALLREPAIQAALKAKFSPTLLSGQPVKVSGTINYKFTLSL
jgi:TonB family protein